MFQRNQMKLKSLLNRLIQQNLKFHFDLKYLMLLRYQKNQMNLMNQLSQPNLDYLLNLKNLN